LTFTLDLTRAPAPKPALPNLVGLTRSALAQALIDSGVVRPEKAKIRATQLWRWIHHYGVTSFEAMTDVAKETRAELAAAFRLDRPEIVERQVSRDGTRKWLIRMAPGIEVETVYIPDVGRAGALCVSSQVGCTLNCTFCHTGTQALVRNLTAAEIVAQVQVAFDDRVKQQRGKEQVVHQRIDLAPDAAVKRSGAANEVAQKDQRKLGQQYEGVSHGPQDTSDPAGGRCSIGPCFHPSNGVLPCSDPLLCFVAL
jgi:hypothetical protein